MTRSSNLKEKSYHFGTWANYYYQETIGSNTGKYGRYQEEEEEEEDWNKIQPVDVNLPNPEVTGASCDTINFPVLFTLFVTHSMS